jgi:hypothetical protein
MTGNVMATVGGPPKVPTVIFWLLVVEVVKAP